MRYDQPRNRVAAHFADLARQAKARRPKPKSAAKRLEGRVDYLAYRVSVLELEVQSNRRLLDLLFEYLDPAKKEPEIPHVQQDTVRND